MDSAANVDSEAFFHVLHWPFGNTIRDHLNLKPHTLHITIGFKPRDVFVYKGLATLLCLKKEYHCTMADLNRCMEHFNHYMDDWEFVMRLLDTCWRNGYYDEADVLTD